MHGWCERLQQSLGARRTGLFAVHLDRGLPGIRLTASAVSSGRVPARGLPLEWLDIPLHQWPSAWGTQWLAANGPRVVNDWGRVVHAWSLKRASTLFGVVVVGDPQPAALSRHRPAMIDEAVALLCDADEAVRYVLPAPRASLLHESGGDWLWDSEGSLAGPLRQTVRRFASGPRRRQRRFVGPARIELTRVTGAGGRGGIVVDATPLEPVVWSAFHSLTAQQRRAAVYSSTGRTLAEVATLMGRSRETIKTQLAAAYDKLGIASRAELIDAVLRARLGLP